jgi:dTDP-4-dehydrorhamnose reductase
MKKIVILGSTGMLGSMLLEYFSSTNKYEIKSSVRDVDFETDNTFMFDPLFNHMSELPHADYFINAIGTIKPFMSKNMSDSIYLNALFPRDLADECEKKDIKLIHITTDCVFSGKDGNYNEESEHDALDDYGKSKSLGEPNNCMVLRTSIIGPEVHQNVSLISWVQAQAGKEINGFTNHLWNGITTLQYAKVCDQIISNDWYDENLYHIHSPSIVNKFELVSMINDRYKVGANITPMEAPVVVDRTMSTKKDLCAKLNIPEIKDQIEEL